MKNQSEANKSQAQSSFNLLLLLFLSLVLGYLCAISFSSYQTSLYPQRRFNSSRYIESSSPHSAMDPDPILSSATDLERRRLESTVDQDLHSLSLASFITNSNSDTSTHPHSFSSIPSVEYPRCLSGVGPHGTPRAATRDLSMNTKTGESPVSTVGHHVSAMTLADGVFARKGGRGKAERDEDEWDPERRLGRLVGELGRIMSDVSQHQTRDVLLFGADRSAISANLTSSNITFLTTSLTAVSFSSSLPPWRKQPEPFLHSQSE